MQLPRILLASGALLGALFFTGCATITRGTTEQFVVQSTPSHAQVRLDTGETGVTPATFTLPRKKDVVVTISKTGYKTITRTVTTKIAGKGAAGLAGNALVGGIIGIGVDAVTGASLNHYPNPLVVELEQAEGSATATVPSEPAPAAISAPAEASTVKPEASSSAPTPPGASDNKTGDSD